MKRIMLICINIQGTTVVPTHFYTFNLQNKNAKDYCGDRRRIVRAR